jgi:hypothetical protein
VLEIPTVDVSIIGKAVAGRSAAKMVAVRNSEAAHMATPAAHMTAATHMTTPAAPSQRIGGNETPSQQGAHQNHHHLPLHDITLSSKLCPVFRRKRRGNVTLVDGSMIRRW